MNIRTLALALALLPALPAGAATVWDADWTLVAPRQVNDFHVRVAFEDAPRSYPRPRKLDPGPFINVESQRLEDLPGVTEVSWTGSPGDIFGPDGWFQPGEELEIGFEIVSLNAPRGKPPVILDAWWTAAGAFVETVPFTDVPFSFRGEEFPPVPAPAAGLLMMAGALGFALLRRAGARPAAGLSCCAGGS